MSAGRGKPEPRRKGGASESSALQQGAGSRTASLSAVAQAVASTHWDGLGLQNVPLPGREDIVRLALSQGKSPAVVVQELIEGDYAPDVALDFRHIQFYEPAPLRALDDGTVERPGYDRGSIKMQKRRLTYPIRPPHLAECRKRGLGQKPDIRKFIKWLRCRFDCNGDNVADRFYHPEPAGQ